MDERKGCEIDEENILMVFGEQGYNFDIIATEKYGRKIYKKDYDDLIKEAQQKLKNKSKEYDAFMCIISAHGKSDFGKNINNSLICLSDGSTVRVKDDLLDKFKNSKDA